MTGGGGGNGGDYYSTSPYRVQRHAANIRERKRMLRSAIGPTGYSLNKTFTLMFLLFEFRLVFSLPLKFFDVYLIFFINY